MIRRFGLPALLLLLAAAQVSCRSAGQGIETGFLNRGLTVDGISYRYVVWVPEQFDPARRWPVVLFLHGAGERGSDGWRQTAVGLGSEIRWNSDRFPAIVVFPQAPAETRWLGSEARFAIEALERTIDELSGDPDRVYLTGLSLGGYGTWHLALAEPDRFAALVPVCGGIMKPETAMSVRQSPLTMQADDPYAFTAEQLAHLPVWIVHGADDPIIPASESRRMFEELERVGADVRYVEVPDAGHAVWDEAYADPDLWEWLFTQAR